MRGRRRRSRIEAGSCVAPEGARRVVLVVSETTTAERLRRSLEGADFVVTAQARSAADAVAAVAAYKPSLCLFASELMGKDCLPIQEMAHTSPGTGIVILARRGHAHEMVGALKAGAAGYVPATRTGKRLIESLELILAGYTPLPEEFLAEL